ncbi:expressed unknown protein [Seminavis robusta]|uniref:Uncharacterized protein n=1 Tax=Seminavis robusta TaxID=568900 RepID=A0A9N8I0N8_9STRA|nr:expressed unknown protein [Seminavis robusta]|eukprot:Sro4489_g354110.1 n/a (109) ;mRNA; f:627-953
MSSSFRQDDDQLSPAISQAEVWSSPPVIIQIANSLKDDGEKKEINLIPTLGHNTRNRSEPNIASVYWLPREFSINTPEFRTKTLSPYFAEASGAAGFVVRIKGYEKAK